MSKHPQHDQPQRHAVVLIVTLLAMVLLAGLVMYVFNTAHHVNQRRHLQDIADASAHAGASWMARGLNTVAMNNVAITRLIAALGQTGLVLRDLSTRQSSLEEVFLSLVEQRDAPNVTPSPKGDAA